jgi:hypothetical protein
MKKKHAIEILILVVVPMSVVLGGVFLIEIPNKNKEETITDDDLWNSLPKYEQGVASYEDPEYGYIRDRGYPMYLYSFGIMHLQLYKCTNDEYYKEKFLRDINYIEKIRNEDWTWNYYDGKSYKNPSTLHNCMFNELFINAYELTGDHRYCEEAGDTVHTLQKLYNNPFYGCYNDKFYSLVTITNYCSKFPCDQPLIELGERLYNYSMSGYNPSTGKWFYNPTRKGKNFYDGHAAYYQLAEMRWFMKYEQEIKTVFPDQHAQFKAYLPTMMGKVSEYVLPSGTFYYNEESPDYTEGTAGTLLAYPLYDNMFNADHHDIKNNARKTIIERQAPNGAYYKANNTVIEIWYTDNIAAHLPKYLNLFKEEK